MKKDPRVEQVRTACGMAMVHLVHTKAFIDDAVRALRAADTTDDSPEGIFRRVLTRLREDIEHSRQTIVERSDDYYEEREL
jgi:hypothetical protein